MRIHFIAIGGAVMHNLAIVLRRKGNTVTGSDDKIIDPAKANLEKEGILPERIGFFEENITADIDAVILGMHSRADNPELLKAQELGLKIYSFPEYLYEVSKKKQRVVIAGSHGKTSITSMVMHVLKENDFDFDYMVGAKLKGFDTSVKITEDAPIIVLEGDEYLASPLHPEPKFMFYKPNVALISGVAWDHINVFPDYDDYVEQFRKFAHSMGEWGFLTWFAEDEELKRIFNAYDEKVRTRSYNTHPHIIKGNTTFLQTDFGEFPLKIFGEHNLQNISGAKNVCNELGVFDEDFYRAITSFEGAANRLQFVGKNDDTVIYKDFAHSPSKLKATVHAMSGQFNEHQLLAVMELHTFSSLNKDFMEQYAGSMDEADIPVVFYDKETFAHKKMPLLDETFVKQSFGNERLNIFTDRPVLENFLLKQNWKNKNLLLMSSGNFAGMNIDEVAEKILEPRG
ncbi:MAG: UDP-N-acetylmuramate-alanine ligase [Bacteroidota bacterium]|nr:UDP-N-acetylmuramate-alanine ligase [Bacteroidota bacterium]